MDAADLHADRRGSAARGHSGKPSQEFLIAVAGPLVNVGIAIVLMVLTLRHLSAEHFAAMESLKVSMIDRLADINLFLAVFNMIPADPGSPDGLDISGAAGNPARLCPGHRNRRYDQQWAAFGLGFLGLF